MKRISLFWIVVLLVFGIAFVAGQAQQPQAAQAAKQKKRAAKNKADNAPQWVWKNPQTPAGTVFKTFRSSMLGGQEVSYLFWAPLGYEEDKSTRFPVAYFLHGGGGNYTHIPDAFLPKAAEAIQAGTLPPFIGIVVNGLPSSFYVDSVDGKTPVESILMKELLPHINATYRTNGIQLIEGFSMGGRGATYLAFKYPEQFRGVADFAGAIHDWDFFSRMQVVAQLFPDEKAFASAWPFHLAKENAAKIKSSFPAGVLIVVGEEDTGRGNTYEWNVKLHDTLDGLGIQNKLCAVKGVRHSYQLLAADAEAAKTHLAYYAAVFKR